MISRKLTSEYNKKKKKRKQTHREHASGYQWEEGRVKGKEGSASQGPLEAY